jgi:ABC-type multidrug transport system fused ATPase/permease subunit
VAILFYGGYLVLDEKLTTDGIIAFLLYQLQLGENFYNLNSVITGLMESVGASRKVFEYMDRIPNIRNSGTLNTPITGCIEFSDVSFSYPTRAEMIVLKVLNFELMTMNQLTDQILEYKFSN